MALLLFLFIGFAITNAVVFLHIGHGVRRLVSGLTDEEFLLRLDYSSPAPLTGFRQIYLGRLIRCHACMGFWVGLLLSLGLGGIFQRYVDVFPLLSAFFADGFLLSAFNFVLWVVLSRWGAKEL